CELKPARWGVAFRGGIRAAGGLSPRPPAQQFSFFRTHWFFSPGFYDHQLYYKKKTAHHNHT
ncbi:hypothetical protein, partial [Enterobacter sichuanensis]